MIVNSTNRCNYQPIDKADNNQRQYQRYACCVDIDLGRVFLYFGLLSLDIPRDVNTAKGFTFQQYIM